MHRTDPNTKKFSRKLRSEMTRAELHLWQHLRMRQMFGFKLRRQHPVGKYILDFACIGAKLVIEVDGGQHSELQTQDKTRTVWLEAEDWKVLRFWNNEILQNTESVLESIRLALSKN